MRKRRRWLSWYLGLLFIPTVRYHHSIYVVWTGNLDIFTRLFNINPIEIYNKTRVGKSFIWFTRELKSAPIWLYISLAKYLLEKASAKSPTCLRRYMVSKLGLYTALYIVISWVVVVKHILSKILLMRYSQSIPDSEWSCRFLSTGRNLSLSILFPNLCLYQSEN